MGLAIGQKKSSRNYEALGQYNIDKANAALLNANNYGVLSDIVSGNLLQIQNSFTPSADLLARSKSDKRTGQLLNYAVIGAAALLFVVAIVIITKIAKK